MQVPSRLDRLVRTLIRGCRNGNITKLDVLSILRRGAVTAIEVVNGDERWTVEGKDDDERRIRIIVSVDESSRMIAVITTIEI